MSADKRFIQASELLRDSFRLAAQIYQDGLLPDFIVGIWRGGTPVGIAIQEYFQYAGISSDHISVRTSSYAGINQRAKSIRVHGLHYLIEEANADSSLLIVDDVFDTGLSIEALVNDLEKKMRLNMPRKIKIACPWFKPQNNLTNLAPDYFLYESDEWLVFPHELEGLSVDEIANSKPEVADILDLFQIPKRS